MPGSIDAQEALLMPDSIDARLDWCQARLMPGSIDAQQYWFMPGSFDASHYWCQFLRIEIEPYLPNLT